MSQDSKVFFRIFLGIGLVLILISVVVFYNQQRRDSYRRRHC